MKLSIVTTLYKSSPYVDEFYSLITAEAEKITDDYEVIFVDDGSPDDSLSKAINLHKIDTKIKVIELSRNFGHHKAIMTGLSHAKGEFIFLIDVDLEEEPELLGKFWGVLQDSEDIDVVYGVQESRKGGWFERWSGEIFYSVYNFLSDVKIPKNLITARIFTKKAKDTIISYNERELCLGCIYHDIGFNQLEVKIKKLDISPTTYTFRKKVSLMLNSIISFSNKPLNLILNIGLFITIISFSYIVMLLFMKLFFDTVISGWTSIIVSIWFFGGLIVLFLGILGMYISKIFIEVKNRPYSIVKNLYKSEDEK